jgi:hypothetical protein
MLAELTAPFRTRANELREQARARSLARAVASLPVELWSWLAEESSAPDAWKMALDRAGKRGSLPALAHLTREGVERNWVRPEVAQALRGFALLLAGARAEGVNELAGVIERLPGRARAVAQAQGAGTRVPAAAAPQGETRL